MAKTKALISCAVTAQLNCVFVFAYTNQRTNGPVNAHLISWPSKAQDIQNLEKQGQEMTLTFYTHITSETQLVVEKPKLPNLTLP